MTKTVPAAEAKTNFGALLDTVRREPVTISKNGRPVAVIMSIEDYEQHQAMTLERLRAEIQTGLDQLDDGRSTDGQTFVKALIEQTE